MWQQLLNSGIIKDVGIFAGAYAAIQALSQLRSREVDPLFNEYPHVVAFGFVGVLEPLCALNQPIALGSILRSIESFLKGTVNGCVRSDGFELNRQANNIIREVESLIAKSKRSTSDAVALAAIDYERDEGPALESMIDNSLRNMLLS